MTEIVLRDGETKTTDPRLNRIPLFDPKSLNYPVRTLLAARYGAGHVLPPLRSKTWGCYATLDQGAEGACVGFSWAHDAAAYPVRRTVTTADALAIYNRAKVLDPWPGEDYSGTAVIAGAQAARERGWLREYRWALGPGAEKAAEDVVRTLAWHGPVVLGIDWHEGDYRTDRNGFITGRGAVAGGHAILARGVTIVWKRGAKTRTWADVDLDRSYITLRNSWGRTYGLGGDCRMLLRELVRRLDVGGEACVPVLR